MESDPAAWLRHYLAGIYAKPFGRPHHSIIDGAINAVKSGGRYVVAAPRGMGKSSVLWGVALYCLLTGRARFPAYLPWASRDQRKALRFWKAALCFNPTLSEDYPEYCSPFAYSRGNPHKCLALTWADNGLPCGAQIRMSDSMLVLPDGLGVIGGGTVNGNPRGLNHPTEDGRVLRPDLALIDDPQDKETARSERMVEETCEIIEGDIAGMGGLGSRLPMLMAATVICPGDVADRFLSDPGWDGQRVAQIEAWPTGWESKGSDVRRLWREWNDARLTGEHERDGGKAARAFYKSNKAAMTAGMSVSYEHGFDKTRGQPDALYAAIEDYHVMGETAFAAERQNQPLRQGTTVYELTAQTILEKQSQRAAYEVPNWAKVIICATDINHYGLHSAALAFGHDQTAAVLWYKREDKGGKGIVGKDAPEAEQVSRIYEALVSHGKEVAALPFRRGSMSLVPSLWLVDGGYKLETVVRYASASRTLGVPVMVSRGYGARNYRPFGKHVVGQPREQCHLAEWPTGRGIAFNADYWREIAQRAWLGSVDAPGCLSLFAGKHVRFSEQVAAETLASKGEIGGQARWEWVSKGPHDFGDAVTMCYAGAAFWGLGTSSVVHSQVTRKRYVERRKCRVERDS